MDKQIAVDLPVDLVAFVDEVVAQGDATNRAAVVTHALERERRLRVAARDAAILATTDHDQDLQALVEHVAHDPLD